MIEILRFCRNGLLKVIAKQCQRWYFLIQRLPGWGVGGVILRSARNTSWWAAKDGYLCFDSPVAGIEDMLHSL